MKNSILEKFNHLIDQKDRDLNKYLRREDASQYVVDKMNNEIVALTELYNLLVDLESGLSIPTLTNISKEVAAIEKADSELNGHTIFINKSEGNKRSQIYIQGS